MTKKETINRNIGLTFDYVRALIKNPSLAGKLPASSEIEFVEKDFPIKKSHSLHDKFLIKVRSSFEPVSNVAEAAPKYKRRK